MSFLPLMETRTVLLMFTRVTRPAGLKHVKGYNHVAWGWKIPDNDQVILVIEPAMQGANIDFVYVEELFKTEDKVEVLELDVKFTFTQKLFKEEFQTCSTFVQYLAGIDLGATLAQTLYDKLIKKDETYLAKHGILGVRKWELKQS